MKKVGFLYWSPGLIGDFSTADPSWIWLLPLFDLLKSNDIQPCWLDPSTEVEGLVKATVKEVDMIFCYWRWQLPDTERYRPRNEAYAFQMKALTEAFSSNTPVIVFDGDLKIDLEQHRWLLQSGARLVMPAFYPLEGYETLFYPMVYSEGSYDPTGRNGVVYIGNNYERYDMAVKYMSWPRYSYKGMSKAMDPKFTIYGNWVDPSPYRESPEQVRADFPNALFPGYLDQRLVIETLAKAKATVHIAKPEYASIGFIALRWFEAVAAGTPAFVPVDWHLPCPMNYTYDADSIAFELQRGAAPMRKQFEYQRLMINLMTFVPWLRLFKETLS